MFVFSHLFTSGPFLTLGFVLSFQVNNPLAHEMTTGPEIIEAVVSTPSSPSRPSTEKVDVMVAGAGTGGTITGISRAIKKTHNPDCVVVGIDPVRTCLAIIFWFNLMVLCAEREHLGIARGVER